jgi:hypothetical protein
MIKVNPYDNCTPNGHQSRLESTCLSTHRCLVRRNLLAKFYGARFELIDLEVCAQLDLKSLDSQCWFCPSSETPSEETSKYSQDLSRSKS